MQGRHTANAADAPCFPVSSSKTTCQMRKGGEGGVCLPDKDVVCMLIGVCWRYVSDGRARDERDQGHGSRKLREPGVFGIFLIYAANMCIPQSCVNLHHHLQRCVHALRLQANCLDRCGASGMVGSCCRSFRTALANFRVTS